MCCVATEQDGASSAVVSQSALEPHDPRYSLKANPALGQQQRQQSKGSTEWQYNKGCWEAFHARDNATARFYKERRSTFCGTLFPSMLPGAVDVLFALPGVHINWGGTKLRCPHSTC